MRGWVEEEDERCCTVDSISDWLKEARKRKEHRFKRDDEVFYKLFKTWVLESKTADLIPIKVYDLCFSRPKSNSPAVGRC